MRKGARPLTISCTPASIGKARHLALLSVRREKNMGRERRVENHQMIDEEFQELVHSLEETPARVLALVSGMAEDAKRWKPTDEEFSATENVCHLRDLEQEGYALRIRKLMTESEPFLNDFDGARLAAERDYNNQSMKDALNVFARARLENVRAVKDLAPPELNRRGVFEGVGPVTLGQLLSMMREHDQSHIEELEALRRHLAARRA